MKLYTILQYFYKKILLRSDFLLPDGIALQLLYYFIALFGKISTDQKWLPNLNGTDFMPYFLSEAKKKYGAQKLCLLLYGTKPDLVAKAKEKLYPARAYAYSKLEGKLPRIEFCPIRTIKNNPSFKKMMLIK